MIDYLRLLLAVLFPVAIGFVFISLITGKSKLLSDLEKITLSFLLGIGVLSLELLLLGVIGIKLILPNILLITALILALPIYFGIKNHYFTVDWRSWGKIDRLNWPEWILLGLIVIRSVFVLFENMIKPVISVDAFANWSFRAKVFFFDSGLVLNQKSDYFLGGGNILYPLNIPLMETWGFNALGYWNDALVKIFFFILFLSLVIFFYCSVRRRTSRIIALISTYLLTTLPLLIHHATIEYADLPLGICFTVSALCLFNYFESKEDKHLLLSALLAGVGTWTKAEGFFLLLINLIVLSFFYFKSKNNLPSSFKRLALYFSIAMIFKLPWSIITYYYHIPKSIYQQIEYDKIFVNLNRIPVIIDHFYNKMFFYGNWNIAWFAFIVVLLLSYRRLKSLQVLYSLAYIVIFLSVIGTMYYITENYVWLLDGTTLNRNILLVMPLVVYFIAVNLPFLLTPSQAPKQVIKRGKK